MYTRIKRVNFNIWCTASHVCVSTCTCICTYTCIRTCIICVCVCAVTFLFFYGCFDSINESVDDRIGSNVSFGHHRTRSVPRSTFARNFDPNPCPPSQSGRHSRSTALFDIFCQGNSSRPDFRSCSASRRTRRHWSCCARGVPTTSAAIGASASCVRACATMLQAPCALELCVRAGARAAST